MVRFENVGLRYSIGPEVLRDVSFERLPAELAARGRDSIHAVDTDQI